jgi:hypothetical protein
MENKSVQINIAFGIKDFSQLSLNNITFPIKNVTKYLNLSSPI